MISYTDFTVLILYYNIEWLSYKYIFITLIFQIYLNIAVLFKSINILAIFFKIVCDLFIINFT